MTKKKLPCRKLTCKPLKNRKECQVCRMKKWREKNPLLASYSNLKSRAKQRGIVFSLSKEQYIKFCDETGYLKLKGKNPDSMSIDRIKNNRGYVEGNIRMITLSENSKRQRKGLSGWSAQTVKGEDDPF